MNKVITERRKFIGSTDAAAVLGLSRWKTPLEVWAEKVGRIEPNDVSNEVAVKLGKKLEETVAEFFMDETGKKVRRVNKPIIHPDYDFIACQIDRDVVGEDAILECKTASGWKAKEWSGEDIPQEYIIQVIHQLAVTGANKGYIAVLIGNQDFKWREIFRDEKVISSLISKEVEFWNNYVVPQQMPMMLTANDNDVLYQLFSDPDTSSDVELSDEANILIEQIQSLAQDQMQLEDQIEKAKNELKAMLGDSERGHTGLWKLSWKKQTTKRIDTERLKTEQWLIYSAYLRESSTRVLRYSQIVKEGE